MARSYKTTILAGAGHACDIFRSLAISAILARTIFLLQGG